MPYRFAVLFALLAGLATPAPEAIHAAEPSSPPSLRDRLAGTWVLQQVSSQTELARLAETTIWPALRTPHIRGFCIRVPWNAIHEDFALIEAGHEIALAQGVAYSVRFMAGRHTPDHVFEGGSPYYLAPRRGGRSESTEARVPTPFLPDGRPNAIFQREYKRLVHRLAAWCREHDVALLHLAWYGQDWAELNHGKEVRAQPGYSFDAWLRAHLRLIDIGLDVASDDLAVELPFSGYGPLTEASFRFADHVVERIGPHDQRFFCQANGWGPVGDWGAPTPAIEAAMDRVWAKPIYRGQQAIQPTDFPWPRLYSKLYENGTTYCEVYAPSFLAENRAALVRQIRLFARAGAETNTP